jgi:hypothetical protein
VGGVETALPLVKGLTVTAGGGFAETGSLSSRTSSLMLKNRTTLGVGDFNIANICIVLLKFKNSINF